MYNIIPLIAILISLVIIILIISKKFSILANIDIANIPSEKEARVKEQIISNRLKRNFVKWSSRLTKVFKFVSDRLIVLFRKGVNKLYALKDDYNKASVSAVENPTEKVRELFTQALELENKEELDEAEKKLIEIISLDSKNREAFEMLGQIYFEQKKFNEAKEIFNHILKIIDVEEEEPAEIYFNISLIEVELAKLSSAIHYLDKALKAQPNNPRYLDAMINLAIKAKEKIKALDALDKLKATNPENQKLEEFSEKIKEM